MKRREASLRALTYDALLEHYGVNWTVDLYTAYAKSVAEGAVLELGAGTGHILGALLRGGVDAYGLEIEPAMIARGRKKLRDLGVRDVKSRLIHGDMRDFAHSRRYAAVILPYNTLAVLTSRRDVLRLLDAVNDHLGPYGEFMFDLSLPTDQDWVSGKWEREVEVLQYEGYCLTLAEMGHYDPDNRRHRWIQEVRFPNGEQVDIVRELRHWSPEELDAIFEKEGWQYACPPVDQVGQPINEGSRLLLGRLRRAQG